MNNNKSPKLGLILEPWVYADCSEDEIKYYHDMCDEALSDTTKLFKTEIIYNDEEEEEEIEEMDNTESYEEEEMEEMEDFSEFILAPMAVADEPDEFVD